jgi:tricorn protease
MWPSGSGGKIAFEKGGFIYTLNLDSGQTAKIDIALHYDNPAIIPYYKNVEKFIDQMDISPTGKRALFSARGDIFSVPEEYGQIENLTRTQGIREIFPCWSPDGQYIVYYSDVSGEYELYMIKANSSDPAIQLTANSSAWKFAPIWSPDSQKIVYADKHEELLLLDVNTKTQKTIDRGIYDGIRDYSWSPDSHWIVYSKADENMNAAIWVYSLEQQLVFRLTSDEFSETNPVFSLCGQYLYFLSKRDFSLQFSDYEFDYIYTNAGNIYGIRLLEKTPAIFADREDQESGVKTTKSEKKKGKKDNQEGLAESKTPMVFIDFADITRRIEKFPVPAGNYQSLKATADGILYMKDHDLYSFTLKNRKAEVINKNIQEYVMSADKENLLLKSDQGYAMVKNKADRDFADNKLDLSAMEMKIDPQQEWAQIFSDGWRIFRDWFYVKNIHNVDWARLKEKYQPLVSYAGSRSDMDYILSEMVAETNAGHCYVESGDYPPIKRVNIGLLGADLELDKASGFYRITKIYQGENWQNNRRSPLTEAGINVAKGDYIIAINGNTLTADSNPYQYLENCAEKRIPIMVNQKPSKTGAQTYTIKPIKSELALRYIDWVKSRQELVDRLSDGKIGYMHLPDTAMDGNRELYRGMYSFFHKKALIIDDRYNGGGFIPTTMTELLARKTLGYWGQKNIRYFRTPAVAHDGPKAMLINHYSSSGGDALPYFFKKLNLGTLIGTRTWGGLIGLSGNAPFVDGGSLHVPTFAIFENNQWIIEGIGVSPDIEVVDTPHQLAKGEDPSLEKAVEVLLKELNEHPAAEIKQPADPDRSKWIETDKE